MMQVPLLFRPVEFFTCAKRWVLGLPGYVQGLLVAVAYLAINPPLTGISTYYWYLPSGFRFAGLLLLPYRLWPWLLMGVFTARAWNSLSWNDQLVRALLDAIPHPLATALAVFWLRRMHSSLNLDDPVQMVRLLSAMLFSALLVLLCNVVYVILTSTHRTDMPVFMLSSFLWEFVAVLIIAPLACASVKAWPHRPRLSRFSKDAFIFLCFPLAIFVFTQSMGNTPLLLQYLRVLVVLPSLYFAFRYGWRGAALSITSISTVVALFHIQDASYTPGEIAAVQMLVAVVGTASLLLGSSLDERYKSHQLLTHQNQRLLQANIDLQRLGHDLQDAAQRNLQIEEEQRRRIAAEIHDELGQNLTALQTELRLAERRINRGDVLAIGDGMDQRIRDMHSSVRGLLHSLNPSEIQQFGLLRALQQGAITRNLAQAGVALVTRFHVSEELVGQLPDPLQASLYRIVQEAATNTIRHARASQLTVHLRVGQANGKCNRILLICQDDGVGLPAGHQPGFGLRAMQDRVVAHNGKLSLDDREGGTRIRAYLRLAPQG